MKSWPVTEGWILVIGMWLTALQPCQGADQSKPIIDIRFEAAYRQIESSLGDEWAPTWGRNDVLYSANDDGASFGGIPPSDGIQFGSLSGNDPDHLVGTTINAMDSYHEPNQVGPDGAMWRFVESYALDSTLFRFAPCGIEPNGSVYSCLTASTDNGKVWTDAREPTFRGTSFAAPEFIRYRP
jgi:hypothetical protein